MDIPLAKKIRRNIRRARRRFGSRGLVFMYHRVIEKDIDPRSLRVTPGNFSGHLMVLKRHAVPIHRSYLVKSHRERHIPHPGTVVTFDDGYGINLHAANPLLERFDVPATVFIATGYLGHHRELWWDELDRVLLRPGRLPERFQLGGSGHQHHWELGGAAGYSEGEHQETPCATQYQ